MSISQAAKNHTDNLVYGKPSDEIKMDEDEETEVDKKEQELNFK